MCYILKERSYTWLKTVPSMAQIWTLASWSNFRAKFVEQILWYFLWFKELRECSTDVFLFKYIDFINIFIPRWLCGSSWTWTRAISSCFSLNTLHHSKTWERNKHSSPYTYFIWKMDFCCGFSECQKKYISYFWPAADARFDTNEGYAQLNSQ